MATESTTANELRKLAEELERAAATDKAVKTAQIIEASTGLELLKIKMGLKNR